MLDDRAFVDAAGSEGRKAATLWPLGQPALIVWRRDPGQIRSSGSAHRSQGRASRANRHARRPPSTPARTIAAKGSRAVIDPICEAAGALGASLRFRGVGVGSEARASAPVRARNGVPNVFPSPSPLVAESVSRLAKTASTSG